jgi:uncharacterized protein YrrD
VTTDADPVSFYLIERGWAVEGSDGERIGEVEEVLADLQADIFDGLTVSAGLIKPVRYVPAERVVHIVEGRVVVDVPADGFEAAFPVWTGAPPL